MVQYRENLKLFHFTSKQFSEHKASDETLKKFDEKFDLFWEQHQGQFGRLNINKHNSNLYVHNHSHDDIILLTTKLLETLESLNVSYDLANIRDEIVGILYQFIYLLSFT